MSAAQPVARPPAGERGATRIADRVVAKIASQAALEALRDAPHAGLVPPDRRRPQVTAVVHPARTRIQVAVDLGYPVDIGTICAIVTVCGVLGSLLMYWAADAIGAKFLFERPARFWLTPKPEPKPKFVLQPAE